MAPRFTGLSKKQIEKLMNDSHRNNFAESDSSNYKIENLIISLTFFIQVGSKIFISDYVAFHVIDTLK